MDRSMCNRDDGSMEVEAAVGTVPAATAPAAATALTAAEPATAPAATSVAVPAGDTAVSTECAICLGNMGVPAYQPHLRGGDSDGDDEEEEDDNDVNRHITASGGGGGGASGGSGGGTQAVSGRRATYTLRCGHTFHVSCFMRQTNTRCPVCRADSSVRDGGGGGGGGGGGRATDGSGDMTYFEVPERLVHARWVSTGSDDEGDETEGSDAESIDSARDDLWMARFREYAAEAGRRLDRERNFEVSAAPPPPAETRPLRALVPPAALPLALRDVCSGDVAGRAAARAAAALPLERTWFYVGLPTRLLFDRSALLRAPPPPSLRIVFDVMPDALDVLNAVAPHAVRVLHAAEVQCQVVTEVVFAPPVAGGATGGAAGGAAGGPLPTLMWQHGGGGARPLHPEDLLLSVEYSIVLGVTDGGSNGDVNGRGLAVRALATFDDGAAMAGAIQLLIPAHAAASAVLAAAAPLAAAGAAAAGGGSGSSRVAPAAAAAAASGGSGSSSAAPEAHEPHVAVDGTLVLTPDLSLPPLTAPSAAAHRFLARDTQRWAVRADATHALMRDGGHLTVARDGAGGARTEWRLPWTPSLATHLHTYFHGVAAAAAPARTLAAAASATASATAGRGGHARQR